MRTLNYPEAQGTTAYFDGLNLAAHHSMRNSSTAKRYVVGYWLTDGRWRGVGESEQAGKPYRAAVKRFEETGEDRWTDSETGFRWKIQEA